MCKNKDVIILSAILLPAKKGLVFLKPVLKPVVYLAARVRNKTSGSLHTADSEPARVTLLV